MARLITFTLGDVSVVSARWRELLRLQSKERLDGGGISVIE